MCCILVTLETYLEGKRSASFCLETRHMKQSHKKKQNRREADRHTQAERYVRPQVTPFDPYFGPRAVGQRIDGSHVPHGLEYRPRES